jgi:hypothetical protein
VNWIFWLLFGLCGQKEVLQMTVALHKIPDILVRERGIPTHVK